LSVPGTGSPGATQTKRRASAVLFVFVDCVA